MKKRLVSGIQPSGNLHIGNYLGAIQQWADLQHEYDAMLFVADLHAITVPQDPAALRAKTVEIAKILIASGLDPKKCTLFVQSEVKEHAELGWILETLSKMGELERMTQYKDKSQKGGAAESGVGLFAYPCLMAADVLLYDAAAVPVGKDQMQHIELMRTLARRFNERFGETFSIPEGKLSKEGQVIMGLDDPTKKMSKSASSEYNFIALTDDADAVRRKIRKAVTDSGTEVVYRDDKPALRNLIHIYMLLSGKAAAEVEEAYRGKGYGEFKDGLAETITGFLAPFQERFADLSDEETETILREGSRHARDLAEEKMRQVKKKMGFLT